MKIRQAKKLTHYVCTYGIKGNRVPSYWRRQCNGLDIFVDGSIYGDARLAIAITTTRRWLSCYDFRNIKKYRI